MPLNNHGQSNIGWEHTDNRLILALDRCLTDLQARGEAKKTKKKKKLTASRKLPARFGSPDGAIERPTLETLVLTPSKVH